MAAVPTRWNSALIMLQRLSREEVWKATTDTLVRAKTSKGTSSKVPRMTIQRSQVLELVSLLEPFDEATQALQGDNVTISRVIPALLGIDDSLINCGTQLIALKRNLRRALYERFQELIQRPEYVVSTILDCRYKLVPFAETRSSTSTVSNVLTPCSSADARMMLVHCLSTCNTTVDGAGAAVSGQTNQGSSLLMQDEETTSDSCERRSIFSRYEDRKVWLCITVILSYSFYYRIVHYSKD